MKKKLLLIIGMFLFITNVNALTFNVDLTNIEDKGNNGTIGSIERIDVANKELDVLFQDIGDEVNFDLTITNSGDRAGTLRSISVEPSNDKIEYTTNLPEGGLAINGNDFNTVEVKAKVLAGAQNGKTSSEIKIRYTYDEGSCPEGEILSDDESMCLCPEGTERNETGICVVPEKEDKIECKDDEIYNETKKICEKKVVPVTPDGKGTPSNPKTMDNIILITLLFFVSGLGIYAVLFKKLKTSKQRKTVGALVGVITLTASFTVLAGIFGLDNLLGAIVNPITKSKELVITVNEEIDLIETWDGDCDITGALTPDNVFDGGSGTESDPYQIKTANQLACFAKSINEGETYEGKFIKQTKHIKLNDKLNEQAEAGDLSNAHVWTSAGYYLSDTVSEIKTFSGTYDGDNKIISGIYITGESAPAGYTFKGFFGHTTNATLKNMILSDTYSSVRSATGVLLGYGYGNLTVDNIITYGTLKTDGWDNAGLISKCDGNSTGNISITNVENNINIDGINSYHSGIVDRITAAALITLRNDTNNGNIVLETGSFTGGIAGYIDNSNNLVIDNCANNGNITNGLSAYVGGLFGDIDCNFTMTNSYNTGDIGGITKGHPFGGLIGYNGWTGTLDNCYNSGDISRDGNHIEGLTYDEDNNYDKSSGVGGLIGYASSITITNSYNTGNISGWSIYVGGIVGSGRTVTIENSHNDGDISAASYVGGIAASGWDTTVRNSYNTGDIITFGTTPRTGGIIGGFGGDIFNSYNEGDILITAKYDNVLSGGLCAQCGMVKNSYNRGNITSRYNALDLAGIAYIGYVENCYNSGTITFEDTSPNLRRDEYSSYYDSATYMSGIYDQADYYNGEAPKNNYNLGDIIVNRNEQDYSEWNSGQTIQIGGISRQWSDTTNSVNAGNIIVNINSRLRDRNTIYLSGITNNGGSNNFNAGTITIDDSALTTPLVNDLADNGEKHYIAIGEIGWGYEDSYRGNKFNTNQNNKALGCLYAVENGLTEPEYIGTCLLENSVLVGTYTDEETPSILSIINGDDAYNDELDEYGLPTLKVFNE